MLAAQTAARRFRGLRRWRRDARLRLGIVERYGLGRGRDGLFESGHVSGIRGQDSGIEKVENFYELLCINHIFCELLS